MRSPAGTRRRCGEEGGRGFPRRAELFARRIDQGAPAAAEPPLRRTCDQPSDRDPLLDTLAPELREPGCLVDENERRAQRRVDE